MLSLVSLPLVAALCSPLPLDGDPVTLEAVPGVASISPGDRFEIAVVLSIGPGFHVYWLDSGASGVPTKVTVTAPAGYEVGAPRYARPRALVEPEGTVFGYTGEAVIVVPLTAPNAIARDSIASFDVRADWLVCDKTCAIGSGSTSVEIPTVAERKPSGDLPKPPARFGALARRLPRPIEDLEGARVTFEGGRLRVVGPAGGRKVAAIFPIEAPGITYRAARCAVLDTGKFEAEVPVELTPKNADGAPLVLRGVITLGEAPDDPSYEYALPATHAPPSAGGR